MEPEIRRLLSLSPTLAQGQCNMDSQESAKDKLRSIMRRGAVYHMLEVDTELFSQT